MAEYGRGQGISRLVEYMEKSGIARQDLPRIEDLPESFLELGDSGQVHLGYLLSFAFVDHVVSQHGMGAAIRWVRALEGQSPAEAYQKAIGRTLQHEEDAVPGAGSDRTRLKPDFSGPHFCISRLGSTFLAR